VRKRHSLEQIAAALRVKPTPLSNNLTKRTTYVLRIASQPPTTSAA